MRYSFSFVDQYLRCPYKWYLKYGLKIPEKEDVSPTHPFKIGHLLHTAIEKGLDVAENEYFMKFPIINDYHIEEVMKVQHYLPQVLELLPPGDHEVQIRDEYFTGYIDYVVENEDGSVDLYDFKYSNNVDVYMESMQLHVYKYYFEKILDKRVNKLYYIFVPKVRVDKYKPLDERRLELKTKLADREVEIMEVEYDVEQVDKFHRAIYDIENSTELRKNVGYQCNWCDYENACIKGR